MCHLRVVCVWLDHMLLGLTCWCSLCSSQSPTESTAKHKSRSSSVDSAQQSSSARGGKKQGKITDFVNKDSGSRTKSQDSRQSATTSKGAATSAKSMAASGKENTNVSPESKSRTGGASPRVLPSKEPPATRSNRQGNKRSASSSQDSTPVKKSKTDPKTSKR